MAESARTAEMYRGGLDHEQDTMPQSLTEAQNAAQSGYTPELSDPEEISYDMDTIEDAFQVYDQMETGNYGESSLTGNEDALDAFGELFKEN
ncbi:MAG: hypothetical protein ABEJ87_03265 [Candidatus Nanohalobium sp.]